MPRTNLSTRPFYNERGVFWTLGLAAALIAALTLFNVTQILSLSREERRFSADISKDESQARTLTTQASKVRSSIDQVELERVIAAAREANAVIDERTFSWTELFNHIERTLPNGVMLTAVTPRVDPKTGVTVAMIVLGREVENVDTFLENLEATGRFRNMLAVSESITEEGLFQVAISGAYQPSARGPAAPASGDAAAGEAEGSSSATGANGNGEAGAATPETKADESKGEEPKKGEPQAGEPKAGAPKVEAPKANAAPSGPARPAPPTVKPVPAPGAAPGPRKAAVAEVQR